MLERHVDWFKGYVAEFRTGVPEDDEHIDLKLEHSLNVLREARAITPTLGLPAHLEEACLLGALYHDTGRFPQYRTYKTFRDPDSDNHAFLGVRALRGLGHIRALDPEMRALVLGAVVLHNRRAIPRGAGPELAAVTRLVRDCDKLDIVRIMLEYLQPGGKRSEVVVLNVRNEPERYTQAIVDQIRSGSIGDYGLMRYENDFTLLLLSWVFDLASRAARKAFLERGHVESLFAILPGDPQLTLLKDGIYSHLSR